MDTLLIGYGEQVFQLLNGRLWVGCIVHDVIVTSRSNLAVHGKCANCWTSQKIEITRRCNFELWIENKSSETVEAKNATGKLDLEKFELGNWDTTPAGKRDQTKFTTGKRDQTKLTTGKRDHPLSFLIGMVITIIGHFYGESKNLTGIWDRNKK